MTIMVLKEIARGWLCDIYEVKMVRGCQKKIIYLKNSGSNLFEEAYFVIKNDSQYEEMSECDMIEEANRIINESFYQEELDTLGRRIISFLKKYIVPFVIGAVVGVAIALLIGNN